VFCASLADVFEDRPELEHPRRRLFELISDTPHLDWLLLTKRPENAWWMLQREYNDRVGAVLSAAHDGRGTVPTVWPLPNVWLGVTAEDQERADERIPILLATPAAVRFVSYEPALGPIDFSCSVGSGCGALSLGWTFSAGQGDHHPSGDGRGGWWSDLGHMPGEPPQVDWVIVGGESGSRARPFDVQWARDTITQGRAAGTPVFVKQLGAVPVTEGRELDLVHDRKGGDMSEWPEDLRVREFPVLGGG
jgi:protein gp37